MSQLSDQIAAIQTQVATLTQAERDAATREAAAKTDLQTQIDALKQQVADLQTQIASGQPVTQSDLDGLTSIATEIQTVTDRLQAEDVPPATGGEVPVSPTP